MSKSIKFSKQARKAMLDGIETLYNAVRVTLGPKGRNVIIEQDFGYPSIVNDGVTIAKSIELADAYENMGASLIIEAASKTNDLVGDGTTTAIILASNLIMEGLKLIDKGVNPVTLRTAIDEALPKLLAYIDKCSYAVKDSDDIEKIAYISSGNKVVAQVLRRAYEEVGFKGIITIEESKTSETYLDIVKGYMYERGYLSPYMINNSEKGLAELINPYILIVNEKITTMNTLVPYLEKAIASNRPILIVCEDIDNEVLNTIVLNKLRGVFNCVVTKTPYYGEKARKTLEDLAVLSGASFMDNNQYMLGEAEKIIVKKDSTTIIDGRGDKDVISSRINDLLMLKKDEMSAYESEQLTLRISKLAGLVAVIKVGGITETALEELRLRCEDALNATRAALEAGITEGGGKVFYQLADKLSNMDLMPDLQVMLEKTLKQPFYQILENAGKEKNEVIQKITETLWFDASSNTYVSFLEAGIIDPTSVLKTALTNALSIAGIFLTTECAIINNKDQEKEKNELI